MHGAQASPGGRKTPEEGTEPEEEGLLRLNVCLGPHTRPVALGALGTWVYTSLDTTPFSLVGESGSFCSDIRRIEVRERTSWKVSMPKDSYEISSAPFLFNIANAF